MAFWACARLEPRREALAAHFLALHGFTVYTPRLRETRVLRGRRVEVNPPLFPLYCFLVVELQWHAARWCPGVTRLVMDGPQPARVPDAVIAEIKAREVRGLIELPEPPRARPGDAVRILRGPFIGRLAIYAGMKPRARVEVLLSLLGSQQRVLLAADAVEAVP